MKKSENCSPSPLPRPVIRICLLVGLLPMVGCGGVSTGEVSGKVTYEGRAVTGGSLFFSPRAQGDNKNPGPPASATVGQDGSYAASPVVAGTNQVTYFPPAITYPAGHEPQPDEPVPTSGFEGLVPREENVDVTTGSNKIDIELVRKSSSR